MKTPSPPFAWSRERTSIQKHGVESRFVTGSSNILFASLYVCTFQPRNFTGWGSDAGSPPSRTKPEILLTKQSRFVCWRGTITQFLFESFSTNTPAGIWQVFQITLYVNNISILVLLVANFWSRNYLIKQTVSENIFILFAILTCRLSHSNLYILQIIPTDITSLVCSMP